VRRVLDFVRRLRAALAERRRIRALPEGAFDEAFDVARTRIGITQQPEEIRWLFDLVSELRPQTVLEIGMDQGGTLLLWTRAAADDALLVAVDLHPIGRLGGLSPFTLVRRAFARRRQRVELVMPVNSHDPQTLVRVREVLRGRPVDFLFVDGDHTYEGVCADVELYLPLVRPGGIAAFHDVSPNRVPWTEGAARFWEEFSRGHATEELVVDREPGFGIGVYRVPG
jgi:cephalosporin hydroxylase